MRPFKADGVLTHILSFLTLASAVKLSFYTPNFDAAQQTTEGLPYFVKSNLVTISWSTVFENTTLSLYQELGDGAVLWELLAVSWPKAKTELVWTTNSIAHHPIKGSKFYFLLQNSDDDSCSGCSLASSHFAIEREGYRPLPPASLTRTTHATSTNTPVPSNPGDVVGQSAMPKTHGSTNIELGVGVGAGVPAMLALIGIFFMWIRHRRDERQKHEESKVLPADCPATPREKTRTRWRESNLSRESGALGPYAQKPSPTWEQQKACEQGDFDLQHQGKHRRGSSARHYPFRPSLGAHSEVSDESSRNSWIDDYDFKRSGESGYGDSPPVPQPVHHWDPARDWPPRL